MTISKLKELLNEYPDDIDVNFICVVSPTSNWNEDPIPLEIEDISKSNNQVQILLG